LIRDGESEGRSGDGGGWNEALAKQPPDAAPSHHHEQNRQCDYSCKRCNDCCERKDIHNAIPKCEKQDCPVDGKRPQPFAGQGQLAERIVGLFGPFRSAGRVGAERPLVALPRSRDLLLSAKDLFVEANASGECRKRWWDAGCRRRKRRGCWLSWDDPKADRHGFQRPSQR